MVMNYQGDAIHSQGYGRFSFLFFFCCSLYWWEDFFYAYLSTKVFHLNLNCEVLFPHRVPWKHMPQIMI